MASPFIGPSSLPTNASSELKSLVKQLTKESGKQPTQPLVTRGRVEKGEAISLRANMPEPVQKEKVRR